MELLKALSSTQAEISISDWLDVQLRLLAIEGRGTYLSQRYRLDEPWIVCEEIHRDQMPPMETPAELEQMILSLRSTMQFLSFRIAAILGSVGYQVSPTDVEAVLRIDAVLDRGKNSVVCVLQLYGDGRVVDRR